MKPTEGTCICVWPQEAVAETISPGQDMAKIFFSSIPPGVLAHFSS